MSRGEYHRPDAFTQKAKKEGYAARSVYKLEEIDQKYKIFKPGQKILDLGAYPGSWSQYALKKVGKKGRVVGIDIKNIEQNLGQIMHRKTSLFVRPDMWAYRYLIVDFGT